MPVLTGLCGLFVLGIELVLAVLLELLECLRAAACDITLVRTICSDPRLVALLRAVALHDYLAGAGF